MTLPIPVCVLCYHAGSHYSHYSSLPQMIVCAGGLPFSIGSCGILNFLTWKVMFHHHHIISFVDANPNAKSCSNSNTTAGEVG